MAAFQKYYSRQQLMLPCSDAGILHKWITYLRDADTKEVLSSFTDKGPMSCPELHRMFVAAMRIEPDLLTVLFLIIRQPFQLVWSIL